MGIVVMESGGFSLPDGQCFNIKNDGIAPVELTVRLAGMPQGESVQTWFACGWNPEIVCEILPSASANVKLKWGY